MVTVDAFQLLGTAAVGAVGGVSAVAGLSRWLGDVWLGRILAKEKAKYDQQLEGYKDALDRSKNLLQAQIDRSVFVTRAHFETEFEAYKRIFEDLAEVRLLMPGMHPLLEVISENETEEDKRKALVAKFVDLREAHNKSVRTVENLGPFYPQEILEKINKCLHIVRLEMIQVQTGGAATFSVDWHQRGEKRVEDFLSAYQDTSDAVRRRIATLAILPQR